MKPLELVGILVGFAGIGVGLYFGLRRPSVPPPPAAQPGQYVAPVAPALPSGSGRPATPTMSVQPGSPEAIIGTIASTATAVMPLVTSLVDFFGSL